MPLNVFTPSSIALSISSMKLSVAPRITIVDMRESLPSKRNTINEVSPSSST